MNSGYEQGNNPYARQDDYYSSSSHPRGGYTQISSRNGGYNDRGPYGGPGDENDYEMSRYDAGPARGNTLSEFFAEVCDRYYNYI